MTKFFLFFNKFKSSLKRAFTPRAFGFYGGGVMSFFAGNILAGKATDQRGIIPSIIFDFGQWQFHLHHWLTSFALMLFLLIPLFVKRKINKGIFLFIFGCCLGLMVQGIFCYNDWHEVFIKKI